MVDNTLWKIIKFLTPYSIGRYLPHIAKRPVHLHSSSLVITCKWLNSTCCSVTRELEHNGATLGRNYPPLLRTLNIEEYNFYDDDEVSYFVYQLVFDFQNGLLE